MRERHRYQVIVIGGGHAGTEAAWAAASALGSGARVALVTMDPSRLGQMSCNPAIGGLAKGQIVREIDALGGIMGRAIDASGIMFKMLNTSKGAAVRGPRAQADKYAYAAEVQRLLAMRPEVEVLAGTVEDLLVEDGRVVGVVVPVAEDELAPTPPDRRAGAANLEGTAQARPVYAAPEARRPGRTVLRADAVVLTTGTFARGLMHTGTMRTPGGRVEEGSAEGISGTLRRLGLELGRLKTGTPPRLVRGSIAWDELEPQWGDERPVPFSDLSCPASGAFPRLRQVDCRITHTTAESHALIRANLDRAPMYSGQVEAETGPRYCPSIEDKVVRFADRESHHVFLEPESLHTDEVYCNGISTSLPVDVQERLVHAMPGCANAEIRRWGYAVEYDMVWPHQIDATTMTKSVRGLFLAGQINCTTGYEEAGGQGVVAGLNAARHALGLELVRLGRESSYIGVMLDDLVTKTPREPYRMFTSRAEHRLLLRADNADERLTPLARDWGLVDDARWSAWTRRRDELSTLRKACATLRIGDRTLDALARRPETTVADIAARLPAGSDLRLIERVVTDARYEGYLARQRAEIRRQHAAEERAIPEWLDPSAVSGLRAEAAEVLARFKPRTMGQAGRLAGVNPADLTLLAVAIRRGRGA